jgi:hypothetical protein
MKYLNILIFYIVLFLIALPAQSIAITENVGQDGILEWKRLGDWQVQSKPTAMVRSLDGKYFFILTESKKVLVYNMRGVLQGRIPVDEGVTSIDTDPQGQFLYLMDETKNLVSILSVDFVVDIDISESPFKDNADAPVSIVVYADFE